MDDGHAAQAPSKASFEDVYDAPDPRPYMRTLSALDYEVPHHGQRVFSRLLDVLDRRPATVVDLCCSYGINAALYDGSVQLEELYARYIDPEVADLSREELVAAVRRFHAGRRREGAPRVVGVDVAGAAVGYAHEVGLLDVGIVADLERDEAPPELVDAVTDVDLVTVTGGIGYITHRTFARVLDAMPPGRPPWVAALCLRTVPYAPIAEALAERGLVTERLAGRTFPQRRFADDQERAYALEALAELGIDPAGKEAEGRYHVDVFLSRPAQDAAARPIGELLGDL